MKIKLDYGRDGLEIEVPDSAEVLQMAPRAGLDQIEEQIAHALARPIGTPPLRQLARGRENACVVIADITRPVPNAVILPPMLQILEEEGIAREDITLLVGTGLHRPNEGAELVQLVGADIARNYRIVNHAARRDETLRYLGQTSGGAPIWINSLYVEADLKIATALIEPHLMAGYSGGRKAICPGLMGIETMRVLHGPELLSHPRACEGSMEGNPFHRQALEVAQRAGVDFTFNVALNDRRQITGLFCGDLEKAHAEGARFVEQQNGVWVDEPVDIAITSSAGWPLDLTFYQAVKGLTAVLPIVKEGGTILMAARCAEGLGSPEFAKMLLGASSAAEFAARLADPDFFAIDQWQLQKLCTVLDKAEVLFYSEGLEPQHCDRVWVEVIPSVEQGLAAARARHGGGRVAVVPQGPYVLTQTKGVP